MPRGRPSKGPRTFVATRLPDPVADELQARAEADGITVNDALHLAVVTWLHNTDNRQSPGATVP